MDHEEFYQEIHRISDLAMALVGAIPSGTPTYIVISAMAQIVATLSAYAADGNRDQAFEKLAEFNRLAEAMTINQCHWIADRKRRRAEKDNAPSS